MNLQGIRKIERHRHCIIARRTSQCYWGRYNKSGPRYAQALSGRTKLWARSQSYNRNRRPTARKGKAARYGRGKRLFHG